MINELYDLSKALQNAEISSDEWHRKYKPLPNVTSKAPCVRIWIGKEGICDFETLNADHAAKLKKYGSNQGTFPAMNLVPLYRITDEMQKQELDLMRRDPSVLDIQKLRTWCDSNNWLPNFVSKLKNSLYKVSKELLEFVGANSSIEQQEIKDVMALLNQHFPENQSERIHDALEKLIFCKLERMEEIPLNLSMLIHPGDAEKEPSKDQGTLSVIWDIENWEDYGHPIASEYFTRALNQMLLNAEQQRQAARIKTSVDAFQAQFYPLNEPMPSVKMAGGFEATIYTMFEGQPCQNRYANFDREIMSFPLAPENRSSIKKALEWISSPDQQGETWLKTDKNEILFAYPSQLPNIPVRLVGFFGVDANAESSRNVKRFREQTSKIIQCLKGLPPEEKPEHICVFVLRKINKGRTKIVFTRNTTPDQLMTAATAWQEGCCNLPDFDCAKKNSELLKVPYPVDVADIMNQVWKIDGKTATQGKTAVHAMRYYQGIELLLDHSPTAANRHYLNVFLAHYMNLAAWYGNMLYSGKRQAAYSQEKQLMKALPVLALLLHQHNIRKEQYMESYPYLLGQILKISDELHALYCRVVRDGKLPSQLAGNALYNAAAETPSMAFALLGRRMTPYIAWAKRYARENIDKKEEESWRAGWLMNVYCKTADQLEIVLTPQKRFDDYEKAQLFLGYLASLPKKREKNTQPNTNDTNLEEAKNE